MFFDSSASKSEKDSVLPKSGQHVRLLNFDSLTTWRKSSDDQSNCEIQFHGKNLIRPLSHLETDFWSGDKPARPSWTSTNFKSSDGLVRENNFWSLDKTVSLAPKKYQSDTRKFNMETSERSSVEGNLLEKPKEQTLVLKTEQDSATSKSPFIQPSQMEAILQRHLNSENNFTISETGMQRKSVSIQEVNEISGLLDNHQGFASRASFGPQISACEEIYHQKEMRGKSKTIGNLPSSSIENELDMDQYQFDILSQEDTACMTYCPVDYEVVKDLRNQNQNVKLIIIDCRYHYEYRGSHIKTSLNISSPMVLTYLFTELKQHLFQESFLARLLSLEGREILIDDLKAIVSLSSESIVDENSKIT